MNDNTVDLEVFKKQFPEWGGCTNEQLEFWKSLVGCIVCLPKGCPELAKKLPFLLLAHTLKINNVKCEGEAAATSATNACECDDDFLNELLAGGAKVSSATIEGYSVSFNNAGLNSMLGKIGTGPLTAWLSLTNYGMMVAAIIQQISRGPSMAFHGAPGMSHFGDDTVLPHMRIPGHG